MKRKVVNHFKKARYMVYLYPAQIEALRRLREQTGVPTAHFIRIALAAALRAEK